MDRIKKAISSLFFLPSLCFALEEKPWFGNVFEFHFLANYEYNFFYKINQAQPQLQHIFNTHLIRLGVDVVAPDTWDWQAQIEFADTSSVSFGYRSFAFQVQKLWLDDVSGDPISLSTGLSYFDASARMRKAFSTPYHGRANFEFHTALGKEWSEGPYWYFRWYCLGAIGQATKGAVWLRADLYFLWNYQDLHQFRLFTKSYFGLGQQKTVFTEDFDGWAHIKHQNVDVGIFYQCRLGLYGTLQFEYLYRVYAQSYPQRVNTFIFTYDLPFSLF